MGKSRHLQRSLSWFLGILRSRDAQAADALRKSSAQPKPPQPEPVLLEDGDELFWTAR